MRNIINAILKTGSGSLANLFFGMASVKIMAMFIGPSGIGLFSLIKQAMLTFAAVSMGGQTALVQGIASKTDTERDAYIRTTFWLFFLGTILTVVVIELFSRYIAIWLFSKADDQTRNLVQWLGLPVVLLNFYVFLKSVMNGFRAIGALALVEIAGPITMFILVYPVCVRVGAGDALAFVWMFSASQMVMILLSLKIASQNGWLLPLCGLRNTKIDSTSSLYFFRIAGTTLATAALSTCAILVVRAAVTKYGGLREAGLFDLAWTLSGAYVMLILGAFGTYYFPVLSGTSDPTERLVLIQRVIRLSTLLMTPMIVGVIVLKPLLVTLLYTDAFIPSLEIVRWMLVGDYLKITSWVFGITVLARADMKMFFWTEAFWNVGFVLLSVISIFEFGTLQGIGAAFIALYLCVNGNYLRYVCKVYGLKLTSDMLGPWLVGLAIVIVVSWQTWDDYQVNWSMLFPWMAVSIIYVWWALKREERSKILNAIFERRRGGE